MYLRVISEFTDMALTNGGTHQHRDRWNRMEDIIQKYLSNLKKMMSAVVHCCRLSAVLLLPFCEAQDFSPRSCPPDGHCLLRILLDEIFLN